MTRIAVLDDYQGAALSPRRGTLSLKRLL